MFPFTETTPDTPAQRRPDNTSKSEVFPAPDGPSIANMLPPRSYQNVKEPVSKGTLEALF